VSCPRLLIHSFIHSRFVHERAERENTYKTANEREGKGKSRSAGQAHAARRYFSQAICISLRGWWHRTPPRVPPPVPRVFPAALVRTNADGRLSRTAAFCFSGLKGRRRAAGTSRTQGQRAIPEWQVRGTILIFSFASGSWGAGGCDGEGVAWLWCRIVTDTHNRKCKFQPSGHAAVKLFYYITCTAIWGALQQEQQRWFYYWSDFYSSTNCSDKRPLIYLQFN
jgi:hypothetical protein